MTGDLNVNVDGANFCWSNAEVPYRVLADAATDAGFAKQLPKPPEPKTALQAACRMAKARDNRDLLVRDADLVGATGFLVVHEHVDPADGSKPQYTEIFRVTLDANDCPTATLPIMADEIDRGLSASVLLDYTRQLTVASASLVGRFLGDVCKALGAVAIRPSGGIYWMPKTDAQRFENLRALLVSRTHGAVGIYRQNVVADDDQIATLAAGVAAELESEIARIQREVSQGIQRGSGYVALGKRAMGARVEEIGTLINRAAKFSTMLGKSIDTAKLIVAKGEAEEALAILSA